MMLLQALHTYKLQIPVTFTGEPVLHIVQTHKACMLPGLQFKFRKAAFWPGDRQKYL